MAPFSHILVGFTLGWRFRKLLGNILRTTPADCSIATLDPAALKAAGVAALALDFDGVLAPHGFAAPLPEAVEWLERCRAVFGEEKIFILSNKPTRERSLWFGKHFPAVRFISGVAKKPFPDGLNRIAELSQLPLSAILMVDDRLMTGCLAALSAGARPCYVRSPYISMKERPLVELFFIFLRCVERAGIKVIA